MASRWTNEFLDAQSSVGDSEADAVIADLFAAGTASSASDVLKQLVANITPPPGALPDSVRLYLLEARPLPSWADADRIRRGQEVFTRHWMQIGLALWCSALAEGYFHWRVAHVLRLTAVTETNTYRRMLEVQQLLLDALAPGGLGPGGAGIATALRVRLMHAGVRALILDAKTHDSSAWNDDWGVPINQEDMAATLMSFSVLMLDALAKLGIRVSSTDEGAYFHAWRVIGYFLGINEEMLPETPSEGRELLQLVRSRHYRPTQAGIVLEKALVETLVTMSPAGMDGLLIQFLRFFIGDHNADLMMVPGRPPWRRRLFRHFIRFHRRVAWLTGDSALLDKSTPLFRGLLVAMTERERGGERPAFAIPTALGGISVSSGSPSQGSM